MVTVVALLLDIVTCCAELTLLVGTFRKESGVPCPEGLTVTVWAAAVSEKPRTRRPKKIQTQTQDQDVIRRCMMFLILLSSDRCNCESNSCSDLPVGVVHASSAAA
jgi:hypothetical protein